MSLLCDILRGHQHAGDEGGGKGRDGGQGLAYAQKIKNTMRGRSSDDEDVDVESDVREVGEGGRGGGEGVGGGGEGRSGVQARKRRGRSSDGEDLDVASAVRGDGGGVSWSGAPSFCLFKRMFVRGLK